ALAIAAGACLLTAWALSRRPAWEASWRALREPLVLTGVLLAPIVAIIGVTLSDASVIGQSPPWVPAATFALLALDYAIAALYPGPSAFATVSALCLGVSLWKGRELHARRFLPAPSFYTLLAGLSLLLVASFYKSRAH